MARPVSKLNSGYSGTSSGVSENKFVISAEFFFLLQSLAFYTSKRTAT